MNSNSAVESTRASTSAALGFEVFEEDIGHPVPTSLLDLVGSEPALELVQAFLGPVGNEWLQHDRLSLSDALAYGRVMPGVCIKSTVKVGPSGAELLAADVCLCGLSVARSSCLENMGLEHVLNALKANTGMRKLDLSRYGQLDRRSTELLTEALSANASLTELVLGPTIIADAAGHAVQALIEASTSLRVLRLGATRLPLSSTVAGPVADAVAAAMCKLHELVVSSCSLREGSGLAFASALSRSSSLRKLDLSGNPELGDGACAALVSSLLASACDVLQELRLVHVGMGSLSVAALAELVRGNDKMQLLDVSRNLPGDWSLALAALKDNAGLRTLRLGDCALTESDAQVLAHALSERPVGLLQELVVSGARVGEDVTNVATIAACLRPGSVLRKLHLSETVLGVLAGESLISSVRRNRTLEHLDLSRSRMTAGDNWSALFAVVAQSTVLRAFLVGDCGITITQNDAENLRGALLVLRELDVKQNRFHTDAACSTIVAGIAPGAALRKIDLREMGMGLAAGIALAACLRGSQSLQYLDLSINKFGGGEAGGERSWSELFASLADNTGLRVLKLFDCRLDERDVEALCAALEANKVLQLLDLTCSGINDEGGFALATSLATNKTLRELHMTNNAVGNATALAFATLLRNHSTLCALLLWRNKIGALAKQGLEQAARRAGCVLSV